MSATVQTPPAPVHAQGQTRAEPQIEAHLLDDYPALVRLAYLILAPSISRQRRVSAAHRVVQRALPPDGPQPVTGDVREFMRTRVVHEAARQASRRSALCRLGGLFAPADAVDFDPCAIAPDPSAIRRRTERGRRFTIIVSVLVALTVFVSLLTS